MIWSSSSPTDYSKSRWQMTNITVQGGCWRPYVSECPFPRASYLARWSQRSAGLVYPGNLLMICACSEWRLRERDLPIRAAKLHENYEQRTVVSSTVWPKQNGGLTRRNRNAVKRSTEKLNAEVRNQILVLVVVLVLGAQWGSMGPG